MAEAVAEAGTVEAGTVAVEVGTAVEAGTDTVAGMDMLAGMEV